MIRMEIEEIKEIFSNPNALNEAKKEWSGKNN